MLIIEQQAEPALALPVIHFCNQPLAGYIASIDCIIRVIMHYLYKKNSPALWIGVLSADISDLLT